MNQESAKKRLVIKSDGTSYWEDAERNMDDDKLASEVQHQEVLIEENSDLILFYLH